MARPRSRPATLLLAAFAGLVVLAGTACLGTQAPQRTLRVASPLSEGHDPDEPEPAPVTAQTTSTVRRVDRAPTAPDDAEGDAARPAGPESREEPDVLYEEEDLGYEDRVARVLERDRSPGDDAQGGAAEPAQARQVRRVRIESTLPAEVDASEPDPLDLATDEVFRLPVAEPSVTSPFGMRRDPIRPRRRRMHRGVDYRGDTGTPVYATASGRAIMAGWCDRGTGNCIVLDHPHGWRSQYFHMSRVRIGNGDWVEQGQHIGDIGSTGRSTGPHLHFQLGRDGRAIDPEELYGTPLDQ